MVKRNREDQERAKRRRTNNGEVEESVCRRSLIVRMTKNKVESDCEVKMWVCMWSKDVYTREDNKAETSKVRAKLRCQG